ncbi:hypothetical protein SAMN04487967_0327 [Natronorubrum sediminis]|uniref:Uncharacterized protein n=1 Tax=Natronorubrum sediminis TaxID=640943 RepID=A0A1H6FKJ8_9EURY|nr:hypothetical protein [Natronorubrum sediminis]SEH11387.1 hypothetical protein SAMN04487967_0327 [Natronorubrum sediminis]
MLERPDVVLAAIPLLAISGVALRTVVALSGVGTGLLAAPLTPLGFVAAFVFIVRELFSGPVARAADESR